MEPSVKALGFNIWGVELHASRGRGRLCIYIDSPEGITVDDCEAVSNQVSPLLDAVGSMPDRYTLEVSSPGLDRILFKPEQVAESKGKQVDLRLYAPVDGTRRLRGVLTDVGADDVVVETETGQVRIEMARVRRARIVAHP